MLIMTHSYYLLYIHLSKFGFSTPYWRVEDILGKFGNVTVNHNRFGNSWWAAIPVMLLGLSSLSFGSFIKLQNITDHNDSTLHRWHRLNWFTAICILSYFSICISLAALSIDTMGAVQYGQNVYACTSHNNSFYAGSAF